jgi:molybdopterin-binding protein
MSPDPLATAWQEAIAALEAAAIEARTNPAVARQLLALFTLGVRTHARSEQERDDLISTGIPAENLPTPLDGDAFVAFAPAAVALYPRRPAVPAVPGPPASSACNGTATTLRNQLAGPIVVAADITPAAVVHLHLAPGQGVWAAVKAAETRVYPGRGEGSLSSGRSRPRTSRTSGPVVGRRPRARAISPVSRGTDPVDQPLARHWLVDVHHERGQDASLPGMAEVGRARCRSAPRPGRAPGPAPSRAPTLRRLLVGVAAPPADSRIAQGSPQNIA